MSNITARPVGLLRLPNRVARDRINGITISTVCLHDFAIGNGFYETCVFCPDGSSDVIARYPTLEEAVIGHAEACELAKRFFDTQSYAAKLEILQRLPFDK